MIKRNFQKTEPKNTINVKYILAYSLRKTVPPKGVLPYRNRSIRPMSPNTRPWNALSIS